MAKQDNEDLTSQRIKECLEYLQANELEGILFTNYNSSVHNILRDLEDDLWVIAPYQRNFVYDRRSWRKASKVIETILLGRIIPPIVVQATKSRVSKRDQTEVVDGQQRIKSIQKFKNNEFRLNLDEEEDELAMLHGLKYRDLPHELREKILHYDLSTYKLTRDSTELAVKIFLDLNTQPVPVSRPYLLLNLSYGIVTEKVVTLLALDSRGKAINPHIWRLFGAKTKKDGSPQKIVLISSGEFQLRVLKALFAFISPMITTVKDSKWLRDTAALCEDKQSFERYGLDSFEEIATFIDDIFPFYSEKHLEKENPFFGEVPMKRVPRTHVVFVEALVDILFLGLKNILLSYQQISKKSESPELSTKIRQAFNVTKSELLLGDLKDADFVAAKAGEFNRVLERIIKDERSN